jgi:hypothetical protein
MKFPHYARRQNDGIFSVAFEVKKEIPAKTTGGGVP